MIRSVQRNDFEQLYGIWLRFYQNEMPFPDFLNNYLCAFVVEHNGQIITAGGVRTIVECIALTDKDLPVRNRVRALFEILEASKFVAGRSGYNNLNAFVSGSWKEQLIRNGFKPESVVSLEL